MINTETVVLVIGSALGGTIVALVGLLIAVSQLQRQAGDLRRDVAHERKHRLIVTRCVLTLALQNGTDLDREIREALRHE